MVSLFALALAVRLLYLASMELPAFDPWRHLALVRNIREGAGFTLFDGQPYLWYSPIWYYACAALPQWFRMEWLASLLSALAAPLTYKLLRRETAEEGRVAPVVAGLLMAASGPLVAYTCHYGPEAPALFLTLLALVLSAGTRRAAWALIAGLAFGTALVLRLNFVFNLFLFIPWLRRKSRVSAWLAGAAIPLLLTWWRNRSIIREYPWVFTWDGLATRSADFNPLSALVVQLHPAVQEGLRRLHEQVVPWPEWILDPGGVAWGLLVFVLCGTGAVIVCRRWHVVLAGGSGLFYFLVLDGSLSSNFFRIYLVLFPSFFVALALLAERLWRARLVRGRWLAAALVAVALLSGAGRLRPPRILPLEAVTPPEELLTEDAYLVNSGVYHPESLIYRFPQKSFIGLPLTPDRLEAFLEQFPRYRTVLWHELSVQDGLKELFENDDRYRRLDSAWNGHGHSYRTFGMPGGGS